MTRDPILNARIKATILASERNAAIAKGEAARARGCTQDQHKAEKLARWLTHELLKVTG